MKATAKLTKSGRSARAAYLREWRKRNPGKTREYSDRYWSKKGLEQEKKGDTTNGNE